MLHLGGIQQIVEIVAQACDGLGVYIFPACGEAVGGAPGLGTVVGGSVEILPDDVLIGFAHIVEDVSCAPSSAGP